MSAEVDMAALEEKLRSAIIWATEQGFKVKPGLWGAVYDTKEKKFVPSLHADGCCCVMGAVLLQHGPMEDDRRLLVWHVASILGVPPHVVEQVIVGFDSGRTVGGRAAAGASPTWLGWKLKEELK